MATKRYFLIFLLLIVLGLFAGFAQNTLNLAGLSASSPAAGAYSLRRLSTTYTGNVIQVRRSSDNDSLNIGFNSNGLLDTVALKTFVGSGNGFVRIWYDQSGRGNNAIQTTLANQPRIVTAGVVERKNNIISLLFSANQTLAIAQTTGTMGLQGANLEMNAVVTPSTTSPLFVIGSSQVAENYEMHTFINSNRFILDSLIFADAANGANFNGSITAIVGGRYNGTQAISRKDGIDGTGITAPTNNENHVLQIGARAGPQFQFNGTMYEILLFPANISSDRTSLETNQGAFYAPLSLSSVSIQSNNSNTALASSGSVITLSFTASKPLLTPTVTIAGIAASVTNPSGNNWQATVTVTNATPLGVATFTIAYSDLYGNIATATSTTNSSSVTIRNRLDLAGLSSNSLAASVYSLRKLSSTYTGNAIQVRRSSDNDSLNIGFLSNGLLDTAALKTFVGAGNGFIRVWYDQSGRGNNAIQTTQSSQPRIISSGVVERRNNRPSILYSGAQFIEIGNSTTALGITGRNYELISTIVPLNSSINFILGSDSAERYEMHIYNNSNRFIYRDGAFADVSNGSSYNGNIVSTIGGRYTGTHAISRKDGADGTPVLAALNNTNANVRTGIRTGGSFPLSGYINELFVFPDNISSDRISLETNIKAYALNQPSLSNLTISNGSLTPIFNSDSINYSATVPFSVPSITITPTSTIGTSTITVNGVATTSGSPSASIPLSVGQNVVTVVVTGDNGTSTKTYTITITRLIDIASITSFTPITGAIGTVVTIRGVRLNAASAVTIGGASAIIISNTDTTLTAIVMPGAVTGVIGVTTAGGTGNSGSSFTVTAVIPPNFQQGPKLVGSGNIGAAIQGFSVDISADGNTAIVGGRDDNSEQGAAWIWVRSGFNWVQQGGKLVGTGNVGAARQGASVAISADGNTAIVGGSADNGSQGACWVWVRNGTTWSQQGSKLVGSGNVGAAQQGFSVDISADGNTSVIGGRADNTNIGATWVWVRSGTSWSQQGSKLTANNNIGASSQGTSVGISADGNTIIVGGSGDNGSIGAAWIWVRSGNSWSQQSKLIGNDFVNNGSVLMGISVALSADGNTALFGGYADGSSNRGAAWVFTRSGSSWSQQGSKLVASVNTAWQGTSVSLSADGNIAVVGGEQRDNGVGAFWIYTRSSNTWGAGVQLTGNDISFPSLIGHATAISADGRAIVTGGYYDNSLQGAAWIFGYDPAPTITSFTPTSASPNIPVTITGTGFTGNNFAAATNVTFGGTAASSFTVVSNTTITASPAAGASGNIAVTTPLGTATRAGFTYLSSNANLSNLTLSTGTLTPSFASDSISYSVRVSNTTASITVTPTRAQANATIEARVNGGAYASVTSGSPSGSLALNLGSNTINVRVTAQDAVTQKIYTLTVTRSLVSDLAGLTNNSPSSTAFSLRKLSSNYTGSAIQVRRSSNNDTTSIGFTTNGDLDTATLKTFVGVGNAFVSIWYDQSGHGNNAVQTTQSRQPRIVSSGIIDRKNKMPCLFFTNNENMQVINSASVLGIVNSNYEYNAVVTPANSTNNFVFGNIVTAADYELQTYSNGVQFIPTASPAIFARVTNTGGFSGTQTAVIGARLTGTQAIARKDGGDGSPEVAGPSPNNYIIMIGSRGITPSYNGVINEAFIFPSNLQTNDRLTLERNQRSYHFNIPGLSNLVLSTGTLSPVFNYLTYSYTTTVSSATSSITVTPTAIFGNETITVNGANVTSGVASGNISLVEGLNTITVVVTAFDGVTTQSYTVAVTRQSTNANLSNLTLSTGTLTPSFALDTISYTAVVNNTTSTITVTPTRAQANATIEARVNGGAYASVTSGSPSGSLALNVGSNTIDVRVTAQDGIATKTYTVTVTRRSINEFYSKSTGAPNLTSTWGTNIDGSGAEPIGFTSNNQVFLLSNANPGIMTANWTVSGTGSKIIVGNGTLLQTLSTGTFLINATVDVANLATLTVASISTFTLGTAATGSTVIYDLATGGQSISAGTYHHLTLNNTSGINSAGGNLTVNGTLTTTAGGTLNMGNTAVLSGTLSTITNNGTISTGVPTTTSATPIPVGRTWGGGVTFNASTGAQTVVAGTFNNLTMSNTAAPNSLGGNITVGGTFAFATSGNKLNLGSNTLTLNGSISNMSATACFTANGLSNLTIGGSGALGTNLFLDQTTIGITNRLNNFTYNRNGQTITLGDTVEVIGMVTPTAGTLATGNKLKLISNATRDAGILTGTGSYITGNVIVERYIPASTRNWRFMASPVAGATLADWQGEMHITGAGGATNGFDPTLSNQPSVFSYNETTITGGINSGWAAAANISDALTVGKGYRVFVRGDRTAGRLTGQISTQNAITVTTINAVNTGNINMNPTFSSSGTIADDGWNLLGNPYPCAIDWNAFHSAGRTGSSPNYSGTDYAHLDAIVYTLDAGANTYSSYNAFSGATIGDLAGGIIPSGAAFWVKTSAPSPSMIIKEIYKTNTTPGSIFKTGTDPKQFSIKLKGSEFNTDEAVFKYVATATTGFDAYDIAKLYGADVNIASIGNDGTFLSANYRPFNGKCDSIMLSVGIAKTGEYTMEFLKHEELGTNLTIAVVDLLTNTIIDVSKTPLYVFFADIDKPETFGNNRFKLIIGNAGITSSIDDQIAKDHKPYLYVYPTHTDGFTKVFTNKKMLQSAIYIYDVTGKLMTHLEQPNWIQNQLELDLNNYQPGMYFIYIMKEGKTIETLKCVKN